MENRRRILIAQNDTKSALQLRTMLLQHGWDVLIANDALQAFSIAIREKPVALLASGELAGGGGLSLLKRMRNSVHTARIAVIAIGRDGKSRQEFLSAGAAEFLEQPITSESLHSAVRRHVDHPNASVKVPTETEKIPQRVASLNEAPALDTAENGAFDELTQLASKLLDAPAALLSLVDKDRQFFASQAGLPPWATSRQTQLSHSFCQWVVCGRDQSVVPDARRSAGLLADLGMRELGIVAYAGLPITSRGETIGFFCAIDSKPHEWTENDLATLRDLCKVAESYAAFNERRHHETGTKASNGNRTQRLKTRYVDAAVAAATRILERAGNRLEEDERELLVGISGHFSERIARSAAANS